MKAVAAPNIILTGQSMASNFTSPTITCLEYDMVGIQLDYTGSPVGVLTVNGSMNGTTFAPLTLSVGGTAANSIAIPTNTSPIVIDLATQSIAYLQVVYTFTSGSGSATITTTKKRIGD